MPLVPGRGSLAVFKQLSANSESRLCGVPLGLELNSKKCEWSWLNPDCNLVCLPITPTSEIQILGVPLGSQEFTESFVKRDLLDVAEGVMSKLIDFEDTQAAIFLLRLSFGIV